MANYDNMMNCPNCGMRNLNLLNYSGLMVIRPDLGLFTIDCPNCNEKLSSIQPIPEILHEEVIQIADSIGAGMGRY